VSAGQADRDLAEIKRLHVQLADRVERSLVQLKEIEALQSAAQLGRNDKANDKTAEKARSKASTSGEPPPGVLAFVHIPKTAGGTVTTMFAAAYSKAALHKAGNYIVGPAASEQKVTKRSGAWEGWYRRGGRVSVGHVPYGIFRKHMPPETRYMTFLREPVDRVLSHYYRHLHSPNAGRVEQELHYDPAQGGRIRTPTIEEALEMGLPQINNLETRFLCGHPEPLGELPPTALDDAREALTRFEFVGIQERFEESLVLLQRMLELGDVPYQDRHVSADRPSVEDLPVEQRALIEAHNQLDAELFQFGMELFEKAVADTDAQFAADVDKLRSRGRTLAMTARERRAANAEADASAE
jgi:hypothetical protein